MANAVFSIIRALPDDALSEFRAGVIRDIASRRRRKREYTSLRRYLSVAALELEYRQRMAALYAELDDAGSYDYDWQKRADLR